MPLRKDKLWKQWISYWFSSFFPNPLADMCIAIAISLLMILICAMATYGAYKVSGFEGGWAFSLVPYPCSLGSYLWEGKSDSQFPLRAFEVSVSYYYSVENQCCGKPEVFTEACWLSSLVWLTSCPQDLAYRSCPPLPFRGRNDLSELGKNSILW